MVFQAAYQAYLRTRACCDNTMKEKVGYDTEDIVGLASGCFKAASIVSSIVVVNGLRLLPGTLSGDCAIFSKELETDIQQFFLLFLCITIVGIVFDFLVVLADRRKWTGWRHATSIELLTIPFEVIPEAAMSIWYVGWTQQQRTDWGVAIMCKQPADPGGYVLPSGDSCANVDPKVCGASANNHVETVTAEAQTSLALTVLAVVVLVSKSVYVWHKKKQNEAMAPIELTKTSGDLAAAARDAEARGQRRASFDDCIDAVSQAGSLAPLESVEVVPSYMHDASEPDAFEENGFVLTSDGKVRVQSVRRGNPAFMPGPRS